jgi:hypothetical protein
VKRRKKWGTAGPQPKPFTIFIHDGRIAVRIGSQRPFASAREVFISAVPVVVTCGPEGSLRIAGEGVVRVEHETTRITA